MQTDVRRNRCGREQTRATDQQDCQVILDCSGLSAVARIFQARLAGAPGDGYSVRAERSLSVVGFERLEAHGEASEAAAALKPAVPFGRIRRRHVEGLHGTAKNTGWWVGDGKAHDDHWMSKRIAVVGCVSVRIVVQSTDSFLTKVGGFEDVPESAQSVARSRNGTNTNMNFTRMANFWAEGPAGGHYSNDGEPGGDTGKLRVRDRRQWHHARAGFSVMVCRGAR